MTGSRRARVVRGAYPYRGEKWKHRNSLFLLTVFLSLSLASSTSHAWHAWPRPLNQVYGIPGQEMTRGKGAESARGVGMWTDLEASLVGRFKTFRDTVLRKPPKWGVQKVKKLAGYCGYCGDCGFNWRSSLINLLRKVQ